MAEKKGKKKTKKPIMLWNSESGDHYLGKESTKDPNKKFKLKKYSRKLRKHVEFERKTIVYKQK